MLGTTVRGMRARALLSTGSVLLAALALASAVLAPMFSSAVTNSYAVTRLDDAPNMLTGLSFDHDPATGTPAQLTEAAAALADRAGPRFESPHAVLETTFVPAFGGEVRLLASDDSCANLDIDGDCPTGSGEVLVGAGDLAATGLSVGDRVELGHGLPALTVVGSYRPPDDDDYWFDLSRLASQPSYTNRVTGLTVPFRPAPFVVDQEVFSGLPPKKWHAYLDARLAVAPDWTDAERAEAVEAAQRLDDATIETTGGTLSAQPGNELTAIDSEVREEQDDARVSIAPAVLSVVLVALALLLRLLIAASELRAPELALASLRGTGHRRMWLLGLAEPALVLAVATPLGIASGLGAMVLLARSWLVPGLPIRVPWTSVLAAGAVLVLAVAISAFAVGAVLRTPLSSQLAGVRRPGRRHRAALVAQLVLVAAAVAVLASKLGASSAGDPDLVDLLLPVLLAVVAGMGATAAIGRAATWWTRRGPRTRSLSGFVSWRALSRRTEGTLVILPLTAAIAIGVFAAGVHASAADWRHSVAATTAPADQVWATDLPLGQALSLTRRVDPDGEHLMAVGVGRFPKAQVVVVDAPRLGKVAEWPDQWSPGVSGEEVGRRIGQSSQPPGFSGAEVAITLTNDARDDDLWVGVDLEARSGVAERVFIGPFPPGTSTQSGKVPFCAEACRLKALEVGSNGALPTDLHGQVRLADFTVDGEPVDGVFGEDSTAEWTLPGDRFDESALQEMSSSGDELVLDVDSGDGAGAVHLNAGGVGATVPGVRAPEAGPFEDSADGPVVQVIGARFPLDTVLTSESTPFLGRVGVMVDATVFATDRTIPEDEFTTHVLAGDDTPKAMLDELRGNGVRPSTTLDREQSVLDRSAYALALRLYAVVAVLVLLMAVAGLVVSTAVQLPSRRRDAAALRVVGLKRRVVMWAVAREFAVVLGGAAVAGIAVGALAQYVVLRRLTLGRADDLATPHLVNEVDPLRLLVYGLAAAVLLLVFATGAAVLTVRGARGSTLRENGR